MITSKTIRYKSREDLCSLLKNCPAYQPGQALFQVFCGIIEPDYICRLQHELRSVFPGVPVCGVTSAAEIIGDKAASDEVVINLTIFQKTYVKTSLVAHDPDPEKTVCHLAEHLDLTDIKCLVVFSSSFNGYQLTNGEPFVRALGAYFEQALVCGSLAGEDNVHRRTFVFDNERIEPYGAVCAAFSGKELKVQNFYNFGWVPIGKKLLITDADEERVVAIDNQTPAEIYRRYLGEEVAKNLPMSAIDFPLMTNRDDVEMAAYMVQANSDGTASFIHRFAAGETVQFGYCHAGVIAQESATLATRINTFKPQALFVYTCISRKWLFCEDILVDLSAWRDYEHAAGFFGYGEIYHPPGKLPQLFSQSLTLLGMTEDVHSEEVKESQPNLQAQPSPTETRRFRTLRVLHHLVEATTREIEIMSEEFRHLAVKDSLTGLANRRHFDEIMETEFMRHKRSHLPLSIIICDIDKFKQYNDNFGHVQGDECLNKVAQTFGSVLRRDIDLVARYGGEEFAFILPMTDYPEAMVIAESVRLAIMALEIPHDYSTVAPYITISAGVLTIDVDEEAKLNSSNLIDECDKNLYLAKRQGRNRVVGKRLICRAEIG